MQRTDWIKKIHRDQSGSTLMLVLVCMTLIALLGSALLMATVANRKMKNVNLLAVSNFYDAESVVEEVRLGLEETAQGVMKEAYAYMLQRYSVTPQSERTKLLKRRFMNLFYGELTNHSESNLAQLADSSLLTRYLVASYGGTASLEHAEQILVEKDDANYAVILRNIAVNYVDLAGYESRITTDITITSMNPVLTTRTDLNPLSFTGYALIADQTIQNNSSRSSITGSVYAGTGLAATGPEACITCLSDRIITRGYIRAANKAKIQIQPLFTGTTLSNEVWAKEIETQNSLTIDGHRTYLDIAANTYVSDDLTLNAEYGDVILKGTYYGYHSESSEQGPDNSSAISINQKAADLDLSEVTMLWLAGTNFLSVPSMYGSGSETMALTYQPVRTGEGITFKGNQIAYLVPGSCLVGVGHNPMTAADYHRLTDETDTECYLSLSKTLANGIELSEYVNQLEPYLIRYVRYLYEGGDVEPLVYLYLNFKNPTAAAQYVTNYETLNHDRLSQIAASMELGNVILGDDGMITSIVNAGTMLTYNGSTSKMLPQGSYLGELAAYDSDAIVTMERKLMTKYHGLISYLDETYTGSGITDSLVKTLIRYEDDSYIHKKGLKTLADEAYRKNGTYVVYESGMDDVTKPLIVISGQTDSLELRLTQDRYGLIITDGDVLVSSADFTGLIITTKNIVLDNQANVTADSVQSRELIDKIIKEQPELADLFYDSYTDPAKDEDKMIEVTFSNWHKE